MCDGVTVMMALRYFSSRDLIFLIYIKTRNYHHHRHTVTEQVQQLFGACGPANILKNYARQSLSEG